MRRGRPLTKVLVAAAAAVATTAAAAGLASCSDHAGGTPSDPDHEAVMALDATTERDGGAGSSDGSRTSTPSDELHTERRVDPEQPAGEDRHGDVAPGQREQALAVATEVLDRYGAVLTELAADPALDLGRVATRWSSVVVPASAFSNDMLRAVVSRVRDDRMIIRPGPGGRSYLHRPTRIATVTDDAIEFSWCGYSPGIGVHVATGEVLDDAVGHASGTGRLVRDGERWLLDSLDQHELVALPAGSSDPCVTGGDR